MLILRRLNRTLHSLRFELTLCERLKAKSPKVEENLRPFLTEGRELKKEFLDYD